MATLLLTLLPILLIDVANPVLFALLVYATGSSKPVLNSSSLLLGHTLAYFFAGIALSFGIDQISQIVENPQAPDFALGGVLGLLLIWAFFAAGGADAADEPELALTPLRCLGLGAVVNFLGMPFALPYFGAINQIMLADVSLTQSLVVLAIYNLGYAAFFIVVPLAIFASGERAKPFLKAISRVLERISSIAVPWLMLGLGLWLVYGAVDFFLLS